MKFSWFILCSLILGTFSVWAEEDIQPDQLTPEQTEFFEAKVRPILAEHCYDCHSNQAKKLKGKLFLDSKWGWATGGVGGPAIIPGDLVESMVIDAVKHTEELVDAMPPKYKISGCTISTARISIMRRHVGKSQSCSPPVTSISR